MSTQWDVKIRDASGRVTARAITAPDQGTVAEIVAETGGTVLSCKEIPPPPPPAAPRLEYQGLQIRWSDIFWPVFLAIGGWVIIGAVVSLVLQGQRVPY